MKIVFFGTADFAVESLNKLYQNGFDIAAVVTAPDKPAGRGMKIRYSPVKKFALDKGFKILQPTNLKDENFLGELREINPELQLVVAFRFLPEAVWKIPPKGTVNLHASLLPHYRGAAPINWAIINGEKETGVTTFFIEKHIDTGKIIFREKVPIEYQDTAGTLHDKLMHIGADLLVKTAQAIETGSYEPIDQSSLLKPGEKPKQAPKLTEENTRINWDSEAGKIYNFIRGLSPYPRAWTNLIDPKNGKRFDYTKIYFAKEETGNHNMKPGQTLTDNKNYLKVAVKDGFINIEEIQLPGKKRLKIKQFLNGFDAKGIYFE